MIKKPGISPALLIWLILLAGTVMMAMGLCYLVFAAVVS